MGDLGPQDPGSCGTPTGLRPARTSGDAPPRPPRPHTLRLGGVQRGCAGPRGRTAAGAQPLTCAGRGGLSAGGQRGGCGAAVSPVPTGLKRAARARRGRGEGAGPRGGPTAVMEAGPCRVGRGRVEGGTREAPPPVWGRGLLKLGGPEGAEAGPGAALGAGFVNGGAQAGGRGLGRLGGDRGSLGAGLCTPTFPRGAVPGRPWGRELVELGGPEGRGLGEAGWGVAESSLFGAEHGRGFTGRNQAGSQGGAGRSLTERAWVGGARQRGILGRSLQWCQAEEVRAQIQGWGFAS